MRASERACMRASSPCCAVLTSPCLPGACRLILFLQQSSVEWASSLWLHVVQEVDPHFQRTVWGIPFA